MMDNSFIPSYLERFGNLHKNLSESIEGLSIEAMDWEPGPGMNSLAVILAHTAGSLRYWIGDVALGEPSGRVRASEFKTRGVTSQEMQHRLDAVLAYAQASLPRLKLEDLERDASPAAEDEPVSRGWALLHALEHGYLHLGHVQLTSQLWKERSVPARG
jgi:uncharacterized damage-inducible protein DinB